MGISNGFALGAVVGRSAVMEVALDSFISSVYWVEATGLVAGRATLREYLKLDVCRAVWSFGHEFVTGVRSLIQQTGVPVQVTGVEAFPTLIFDNALPHQDELTTLYMQETASRGLFGGPAHFFCSTHTELDLRCALIAIAEAFTLMRKALDDGDIVKFLKCPVRQSGFKRMV